jgi:hypothetical protein
MSFRNDGTVNAYQEVVFIRDVLRGQALAARSRAERLRLYAAPGGLESDVPARVVDEQAGLPDDVLARSPA